MISASTATTSRAGPSGHTVVERFVVGLEVGSAQHVAGAGFGYLGADVGTPAARIEHRPDPGCFTSDARKIMHPFAGVAPVPFG
jgi:hypothetical protein